MGGKAVSSVGLSSCIALCCGDFPYFLLKWREEGAILFPRVHLAMLGDIFDRTMKGWLWHLACKLQSSYDGQSNPSQRRIIWTHMSIVSRMRASVLRSV